MANAIKWLAGLGIMGAILVALYARYIEPKRLEVTELDLSKSDNPLTIAFVTDTHIGPHFRPEDLEITIRELERIRPDAILFGGDFICESPRFLNDLEEPLRRMVATAKLGSWGIWGNHDIANIRERVAPILEQCGVQMLTNESVQLGDDLWIVGIDDALLGKADVEKSFSEVPSGATTIALWHESDLAHKVVRYEPLVMLSGHSHGGQVRLPVIGALAAPSLGKTFVAGHYNVDGMLLYVSRGIGMYRPPVRLNCRPELVVIRVDGKRA